MVEQEKVTLCAALHQVLRRDLGGGVVEADLPDHHAGLRDTDHTGVAQIVSQVQVSDTDSQSMQPKNWAKSRDPVQP